MADNMIEWKKLADEVLDSFFDQTKKYISRVLASSDNHMDCLLAYYQKAWEVPKRFKGNSTGISFVPEFLIFETIKQQLEKKYPLKFQIQDRTQISSDIKETAYFIDEPETSHLLIQGLRIKNNEYGYPPTDYQHDVTYLVKDGIWRVKALIEVKGYYESPSMNADFEKLENAANKYRISDDCLFAFVGFIKSSKVSQPAKELISSFVKKKNHYFISPGEMNPEIGNSRLEVLLDRL